MKGRETVCFLKRLVPIAASLAIGGSFAACFVVDKTFVPVSSVTLDHSILEFRVGDSAIKLVATVLPSNATNTKVTWSSSNPQVVSVDELGMISPLVPGIATITVITEDGTKTAVCAVTVYAVSTAISLTLDKSTLDLLVGSSAVMLVATVRPANTKLIWLSSNESVVVVDQLGNVTPVSIGYAQIIVKTADGASIARCFVTVGPIEATGVVLDFEKIDLTVGGFSAKLTATLKPVSADNQMVRWVSSNEAVAKVSSGGIVTALGAGTAVIAAIAEESRATCEVTVHSDEVVSGNTYLVAEVRSGRCIEIEPNEDSVQLWECNSELRQRFRFEANDDGYFSLVNVDSNRCVDVEWATKDDGAKIIQYPCTGDENQQWQVEKLGKGVVRLLARHSGKVMDTWQGTENGTNVWQWTKDDDDDQKFHLNWVDENSLNNGWYFLSTNLTQS